MCDLIVLILIQIPSKISGTALHMMRLASGSFAVEYVTRVVNVDLNIL